jgi:hypothetical protein
VLIYMYSKSKGYNGKATERKNIKAKCRYRSTAFNQSERKLYNNNLSGVPHWCANPLQTSYRLHRDERAAGEAIDHQ